MIDKPENYYNFIHPNQWVRPGSFNHRLGKFQCVGIPIRIKPITCVILHITDWDKHGANGDPSAEQMAHYLADPTDLNKASVHLFADIDSFVISMPTDAQVFGCANPNTGMESIEIELSGTFKNHANPEYWKTEEGIKKLKNAVAGLKQMQILCHFDMPPLQPGKLNSKGNVIQPGFLQHRDVPIFRDEQWRPPPESFKYGQHEDICEGFPYDVIFELF